MGHLDQLRVNLLKMTSEQKLARIRQIRQERKIIRNPTKEKKVKRESASIVSKIANALKGMSQEELMELLK